jgi:hypothetical protein
MLTSLWQTIQSYLVPQTAARDSDPLVKLSTSNNLQTVETDAVIFVFIVASVVACLVVLLGRRGRDQDQGR